MVKRHCRLNHSLKEQLLLRADLAQPTFFPNISDTGQYRFQFNATSATKLKSFLSWQITFSDIYISNPLAGLKGNDLLLSTGLRLTFGKQ